MTPPSWLELERAVLRSCLVMYTPGDEIIAHRSQGHRKSPRAAFDE